MKPRAPSCLNSRLLGNVTVGHTEPRTHVLGNWRPEKGYAGIQRPAATLLICDYGGVHVGCPVSFCRFSDTFGGYGVGSAVVSK